MPEFFAALAKSHIHASTCRDLFHQEIQSNEIAPEVCSPVNSFEDFQSI